VLDQLDLTQKLDKPAYKARLRPLQMQVAELGRLARAQGIPVILIFEGWSTAGKGDAIAELTSSLDPRGYRVYNIVAPTQAEQQYPWMHRFFLKTPARGETAIFHGSWYRRVLFARVSRDIPETQWSRAFQDIQSLERALAEDGTVIIKLWLHISRQEQRTRIKDLLKHEATAWRVRDEERLQQKHYDEYVLAAEEMFGQTEAEFAPWTVIPATDRRYMKIRVFETIILRLASVFPNLNGAAARPADVPSAEPR